MPNVVLQIQGVFSGLYQTGARGKRIMAIGEWVNAREVVAIGAQGRNHFGQFIVGVGDAHHRLGNRFGRGECGAGTEHKAETQDCQAQHGIFV